MRPWIRVSRGQFAVVLAAGTVVLAGIAVYSNAICCPFVFDDEPDIVDNASIRRIWPLWSPMVLRSGGRTYLTSRPAANFLFAMNYAAGRLNPRPYHLTNITIHLLAGLVLLGIVRRTLGLPKVQGRFGRAALPLAAAVALLWTLHPLQTAAVTCTVQRYESLMGLFYLLSLYASIRCGTSARPGRWAAAAVGAAMLAMGTKEVAVSLPIVILLYDRALLAGSFAGALRKRRGLYVGLAAAWVLWLALQAFAPPRCWAGYGLPVAWHEYARSQPGVILHYLRLAFWPRPLVLDYAWPVGGLPARSCPARSSWAAWGWQRRTPRGAGRPGDFRARGSS